jgi:3-dehydroquinate synthase
MKLSVKSSKTTYDIIIEKGLISHIDKYLDVEKHYVIISDDQIPESIVDTVRKQLNNHIFVDFPAGEQSKSLKEYSRIINLLIDAYVTKNSTIIALGGGVTGDLAGYIAATLYRGIDFVQIPTTLLSQIDSSVGGKVAVNSDNVKNAIGTVYPPRIVLIDSKTLNTLSDKQYNSGIAEMLKYGLIGSREIYQKVRNFQVKENIDDLIYKSLEIKKHYVEIDEFDQKERHILNFGHTYGHAYEAYYDYDKYLHGEAVALGMIKVINKDLLPELKNVLELYNLPTSDPVNDSLLIDYIKRDKKTKTDTINMVFVDKIGEAYIKEVKINEL